jgi:DNA-binding transcriptional LysR family regulator
MSIPDLNLLITLEALLCEGSVAGAARRLRLSPSAMSRALARLREVMGDPLLVRAGRGLVPTPRALELGERVGGLVQEVTSVLRPAQRLDLAALKRSFCVRSSDGFVENFGPALLARMQAEAPGVRLRFMPKLTKDSAALRDGSVDLETGVVAGNASPELRTRMLFADQWVGVVRAAHPLSLGPIKAADYAAGQHVLVSRRGLESGPVDESLAVLGLQREISTVVSGFATALALARATDLIATVPERHCAELRRGMHSFALPLTLPGITVSMLWHPRMDADAAHHWLRDCVRAVCGGRREDAAPI